MEKCVGRPQRIKTMYTILRGLPSPHSPPLILAMDSTHASDALAGLSPRDASLFARFGFGHCEVPPFRCVHHAFEHQAVQHPDAIAVDHLGQTITYAELDRMANALARRLRDMGVGPGSRVCLLVQRSIAMVIGIVSILKAGAAYVPLDGSIVTQSTLEFVIENSSASVILTLSEYIHRVSSTLR